MNGTKDENALPMTAAKDKIREADTLCPTQVPERAVHARGTGAPIIAISPQPHFLGQKDKKTPIIFVRFSTVAGSRGSADSARDVHGFAIRLLRYRLQDARFEAQGCEAGDLAIFE
ncbi:catalase [Claviceps capensis]|nr:catalase [Claviceps capensis]